MVHNLKVMKSYPGRTSLIARLIILEIRVNSGIWDLKGEEGLLTEQVAINLQWLSDRWKLLHTGRYK